MNTFYPSTANLLLVFLLAHLSVRHARAAWAQTAKFTDPDKETGDGDQFGYSIATKNGILAVGARFDNASDRVQDAGSVTIFEWTDGAWVWQAKLTASDPRPWVNYGCSVAISSNGVVAVGIDTADSGAVYLYVKGADGLWTEQQKLVAHDEATCGSFGRKLAIQGDTLIVGASGTFSLTYAGSAYVYTLLAGIWTEQAKLTPSDGVRGDEFGSAVAVSKETVVVGSPDGPPGNHGSVYLFQRQGNIWTEYAKLTPSGGVVYDWFGSSVAVEDNTVCVGAYWDPPLGHVIYVFGRDGYLWTEQARLFATDSARGDQFGRGLAIQGSVLIVGSPGYERAGAVFVFENINGGWTEQAKLLPREFISSTANFGFDVDFDDGVVVAGAMSHGEGGAAYAFKWRSSGTPSGPIRRLFCTVFVFLCRD